MLQVVTANGEEEFDGLPADHEYEVTSMGIEYEYEYECECACEYEYENEYEYEVDGWQFLCGTIIRASL